MKKGIIAAILLLAALLPAAAQTCAEGDCDCASCMAKEQGFTLPGLAGLPADYAEAEHDAHLDGPEKDSAPAQDQDSERMPEHDVHAGHNHGSDADGVALDPETAHPFGIAISRARGGTVADTAVLPAEIKLNRDTTVAVSARYPSVVRQVFAEIGDKVRQGDILASLENRETMAVYTVAAPRDGVIISKDLAAGESATEDRVLYEVADLSTVWADISVFPRYLHKLGKGMAVQFIAHDGHTADGYIQYISPIVSHETRTFTARCVLEGADADFTPGAFVRARVTFANAGAAVLVPQEAVQMIDGESMIFVPQDGGFKAVHVRLGPADDHHVAIISGLNPGEEYVSSGAFTLKAEILTGGMDPHAGHGH